MHSRHHEPSALILSKSQYQHLWSHLNKDQAKIEMNKQEEEYREFLRVASKQMTDTWENSIEKSRLRKEEEDKRIKAQAITKDEEYAKQLTLKDEAKRNEIIQKAEKLIAKSKVGPRSLESAALLSEVLFERQLQVKFQEEKRHEAKLEKVKEAREILDQAKQWVEQSTKKIIEERKKNEDHKLGVRSFAEKKEQERIQKMKEDAAHHRNLVKLSVEEAKEKERLKNEMEAQKKIDCKKNLLEAININKDKKRREKAEENVQNAMNDYYILGKSDIVTNKRVRKKNMTDNAEKIKEIVAEKYLETQKKIDQRVAADAFALFKSKRSVDLEIIEKREAERREQAERIKAMRLQQQVDLEKRKQVEKQKIIKEIQDEASVLVKNNLVTMAYKKQKVEDIKKKTMEIRKHLDAQLKEKYDEIRKQKRQDLSLRKMNHDGHINDDKDFYQYANDLLKDAREKGRPLLQLKRAVDAYQRNNLLRYKDKDNRDFLFSKVPIGLTEKDRPAIPKQEDMIVTQQLEELKDLKIDQKY